MEASDQKSNDEGPVPDTTEQYLNQPTTFFDGAHDRDMKSSSPHVTFEIIHDDGHHDDASLGFYNSSFDSLSETGAALLLGGGGVNDNRAIKRSGNRIFASSSVLPHGQDPSSDIDLPDLNSPNYNVESSDMSLGDLSPIKLIYSEGCVPKIPSHSTNSKESDFDWRSDDINVTFANNRSNPFYVLRSVIKAFANVRYILPCLRLPPSEANTIRMSNFGSIRQYKGVEGNKENSPDLMISIRRVESAICAFGGNVYPNPTQCYDDTMQIGSDAPTSTRVEENHSSGIPSSNCSLKQVSHGRNTAVLSKGDTSLGNELFRKSSAASSDGTSEDPTKLKYRCKRCGQIKQNHVCPFQQPLQRSIGVMVYPALNPYNAAEPGVIAPSLSKMNNFISYDDSDQGGDPSSDHVTQHRPKIDDGNPFVGQGMTVTPESLRGTFRGETHFHSPQSSLSAQSSDDHNSHHIDGRRFLKRPHNCLMDTSHSAGRFESNRNATFVASISLRPEQYRAVTPFTKESPVKRSTGISNDVTEGIVGTGSTVTTPIKAATSKVLYQYPAIPLSFAERKRMSDTLFYLSKEIPTVTSDCATILRTARQNKEWDRAVAELLTQVVVALYCGEGDLRLDGLQHFLLSLGISC